MLFIFFLAWVPAFFYVASKLSNSLVAGAVTLLAVVWSVPNYPAAMPSWYNLFFATFGLAALLYDLDRPNRILLALAGACGGASFLCKQSGMFFVSGVFLYLIFRNFNLHNKDRSHRRWLGTLTALLSVGAYGCGLTIVITKSLNLVSIIYFLIPALVIDLVLLVRIIASPRQDNLGLLVKDFVPFLAGLILVLAVFVSPYIASGSLIKLLQGVFLAPEKRFVHAVLPGSSTKALIGLLIDIPLILMIIRERGKLPRWFQIVTFSAFVAGVFLSRRFPVVLKTTWAAMWMLLPVALVTGAIYLIWHTRLIDAIRSQQRLFLILAVTANCSLIQFPYTTSEYFCFVAPIAALTVLAVAYSWARSSRVWSVGMLVVCIVFMAVDCTPGWVWKMGVEFAPDDQLAHIAVPRARGLRVDPASARTYEELGRVIDQHASGQYIYATPDAPEIYFLYGFRNPTRTLWDFLGTTEGRTEHVLATIDQHHVNLVVIRSNPFSSGPVPADLRAGLFQRYPNSAKVNHFDVRWR
ncbi:MAG TPA: hypothetical protein VFE61_11770 [Candidatus Sulfotelmatobacter sp.]|jgi:hypothetical protein|nr:hypothetical protein [Candidatus Sulfotelmatobacter sp.]